MSKLFFFFIFFYIFSHQQNNFLYDKIKPSWFIVYHFSTFVHYFDLRKKKNNETFSLIIFFLILFEIVQLDAWLNVCGVSQLKRNRRKIFFLNINCTTQSLFKCSAKQLYLVERKSYFKLIQLQYNSYSLINIVGSANFFTRSINFLLMLHHKNVSKNN